MRTFTSTPPPRRQVLLQLVLLMGASFVLCSKASSSSSSTSTRRPHTTPSSAFAYPSSFSPFRHHQAQAQGQRQRQRRRSSPSVQMRDASMVRDFEVGDVVRIQPGVLLDGMEWGGLEGTVTTTWVKCEVDPHCCCAELGTEGPIRVDFVASRGKNAGRLGAGKDSNYNFFNENELVKLSSGGGGERKG